MRVLIVDDHDELLSLVGRTLQRDGHVVRGAGSLGAARAALADDEVDLIVLDLGLPDGDGVDLVRELRASGRGVPVLVLSAQAEVGRRVAGFDAGADDFLAKPFAVAELRARVRALGRRGNLPAGPRVRAGLAQLDLAARRAEVAGAEVELTAREWSIVDLLARRAGRVVPRLELLEIVWGEASDAAGASLEVLVGRIRRKLGEGAIRTLRGEGYGLGE